MNSSPGSPGGEACARARSRVLGADRRRPAQHRPAVGLVASIRADSLAGRRQRRLHLLALDHHRAEVAADAAALEPGLPPQRDGERIELAEVGRPLDRRAGEPERRRRVAVVDAGVAVDVLLGEHLRRRPPRPGQGDLGREQHQPYRTRHCPAALQNVKNTLDVDTRSRWSGPGWRNGWPSDPGGSPSPPRPSRIRSRPRQHRHRSRRQRRSIRTPQTTTVDPERHDHHRGPERPRPPPWTRTLRPPQSRKRPAWSRIRPRRSSRRRRQQPKRQGRLPRPNWPFRLLPWLLEQVAGGLAFAPAPGAPVRRPPFQRRGCHQRLVVWPSGAWVRPRWGTARRCPPWWPPTHDLTESESGRVPAGPGPGCRLCRPTRSADRGSTERWQIAADTSRRRQWPSPARRGGQRSLSSECVGGHGTTPCRPS